MGTLHRALSGTPAGRSFEQTFKHRILHADPHPGNYLFEPDGRVGLPRGGASLGSTSTPRSSALIAATERAPDDDARRLVRALLASGPPGRTRPVRVAFAEAIVRHVQGPAQADPLGLRDGPAKHLIPLVTLPNGPLSWLGRRSARAEALLVSSGERYWRPAVGAA